VQDQVIALHYVPSELRLADFFIKAQTRAHHSFFLSKLSVMDPPWVWGEVLDVYLYILVSPPIRGFPAYLHTCTCIYMWHLAPMEYKTYIPNKNYKKSTYIIS
jgi:hypothetical protein